ncbi:MAG TPA: 2-oxoacid:ferredoxin oxidoreductase subunit beta [Thermoanaerobaculia bacterium]|nr:2-oxoacid:ferredoxin oxidoreductase subunit beta [Thermoanaerobaculia bacterium]
MPFEPPATPLNPGRSPAPPPAGVPLSKKDFQTDQEVRWCPGCGDYAILSAVQQVFPELGIPREKFVVVSGIGCSSRFPYYMNTFGFHSIHGRAPAVATGLKMARPELEVWIATGDGDSMSIGGNHLIHILRRNVGVKILMFNNRIYGLTKGQYSPTSEPGKRTKSTPVGSVDTPFNPLALALGAGATFVARSVDIFQQHLKETLRRAAKHKGTAFVEIYQNCNIFNDRAFAYMTEKEIRDEQTIQLEHGKPMVFGKNRGKGIRMRGTALETFELGTGRGAGDGDGASVEARRGGVEDCQVWDERADSPALAFLAAQLLPPHFPTPLGVLRCVDRPTYESLVVEQIDHEIERKGAGKLDELIASGDTWTVPAAPSLAGGAAAAGPVSEPAAS